MKKIALVGCLVSAMAFAADKPAAPMAADGKDPMMGWTPRKVTKEDKKAVTDFLEANHKMWMAGNIDGAMANYDFPIFMMTDDKDGNVSTMMTDAASWKQMMEPMMKGMMENKEMMAAMAKMPKPKHEVFYLTDAMVMVTTKGTMPMGPKEKHEFRNSMIVINKGGKWMVKGEMEGGWGDMSKKTMETKPMDMKPAANAPGGPTKGM